MIILALDTTAVTASVALLDNSCVIASFSVHNKLTHSEKLLKMIDDVLQNSSYTIDDVDLIAVSVGPGSFTGVRIGVATAKGISFGRNIPIVGVSALEAMAENLRLITPNFSESFVICPSMDARRNELYNSLFLYDGVELTRITNDRPISCEELLPELERLKKRVVINGDGAEKLYDFLKDQNVEFSYTLPCNSALRQNAVSVGVIALREYNKGNTKNANDILPLYLRTSQAERVNNK
jgi:tRNA threonylcarbamoyladenosine biosynthesis protein TsaB